MLEFPLFPSNEKGLTMSTKNSPSLPQRRRCSNNVYDKVVGSLAQCVRSPDIHQQRHPTTRWRNHRSSGRCMAYMPCMSKAFAFIQLEFCRAIQHILHALLMQEHKTGLVRWALGLFTIMVGLYTMDCGETFMEACSRVFVFVHSLLSEECEKEKLHLEKNIWYTPFTYYIETFYMYWANAQALVLFFLMSTYLANISDDERIKMQHCIFFPAPNDKKTRLVNCFEWNLSIPRHCLSGLYSSTVTLANYIWKI